MTRLWEQEVIAGLRDSVPRDDVMRRLLTGFDWEACSRVDEGRGAVLVLKRDADARPITRVEAAAAPPNDDVLRSLLEWGVALSRAAGAPIAQVWRPVGTAGWLRELGLEPVRPWWRMDRSLETPLPPVQPVDGYRLLDPAGVPAGAWADAYNHSFADHWRHSPRAPEQLGMSERPDLSLMAADAEGRPAAITLCEIETLRADARPQPVGLVASVGTLPAHRRRGLARWLVAESLTRLKAGGAATASLYVDGRNEHRAAELYSNLGFVVTFDTTVWEATFP
ncbi:MAG TPA: GNAT family N-acetyltransferase [Candidatus Dormibacteraeota bacterium]|nr:GNAT family N-acetyltransferase [Candidatus Dormibacteraeota bacterium]